MTTTSTTDEATAGAVRGDIVAQLDDLEEGAMTMVKADGRRSCLVRTATGVHAAAIIKAEKRGDMELADRVYSSVPARVFGRKQVIEIGHYSGRSNVIYWLQAHGYDPQDELVDRVFEAAKGCDHTLTDQEVRSIIDAS